jgi:thiol:disulfide interchange protein
MTKAPNQRKRFLINPAFQISVIKQMFGLTCLVIAIFYAANAYHFWSLKAQGLALGLPEGHVFFRFLAEQQARMDVFFLVTSVLTLLTIVGYGLFLSHRVAGPLHRLKQYLAVAPSEEDRQAPLKFRTNDYFPEVAEAVNLRLKKSVPGSTPKP